MERVIDVQVRNRVAHTTGKTVYICGNSDFMCRFDFDEEWAAHDVKTARFVPESGMYTDVVFTGNECAVPVLSDTYNVKVGVFAGNLQTTTSATFSAKKSILCSSGVPADPAPDVYAQIMTRLNEIAASGVGGKLTIDDEGNATLSGLAVDADGNAVI